MKILNTYFKNLRHFKLSRKSLIFLLCLFVGIGFFWWFLFRDLPAPSRLSTMPPPQSTKIYDRNGILLYSIYANQNRETIPLEKIPLHLRQATIAIEDKDFYQHTGINFFGGILRALKDMLFTHTLQGGSTLTQQLVKNSLLTPERTLQRKIKEIILAFFTERVYSKNEILAMYLNQIPFGGTAYGLEAATETYFGKKAQDLTLAESALLAGLPAAPSLYSPFGSNPELAKHRQSLVLQKMLDLKFIDQEEFASASAEPLKYNPAYVSMKAPHFVLYVKDLLVQKYGLKTVETSGLKVVTTLDYALQEFAQNTVASEVAKQKEYRVGNAAALVTKPSTGEILAMVGSKNYFATDSGNVNVTLANRSPGSSIKPLNYALALETGKITPATMFLDVPYCLPAVNQKTYCPQNYDGKFHGPIQTRFALGNSLNIPAIKVLQMNGLPDFLATASAMGISTFTDPSRYGLSLTLGAAEIKMTDMATAFGIFSNAGFRRDLNPILKVEDSRGHILEEFRPFSTADSPRFAGEAGALAKAAKRVLSPETTYLITHILLDDNARQMTFGANSLLNISKHPEVAVKTGTAENKRDNWTLGYGSDILTAVWTGNNDNSPMSPYVESGSSGAAPIWHKIMAFALKDKPAVWPQKPIGVVGKEICQLSGKLPANNCPTRYEFFNQKFLPTELDPGEQKATVHIDKTTGKQYRPNIGEKLPDDRLELREVSVLSDPVQQNICINCLF